MKRASKQLINAIIALVVSVILCIGVCLAWFAMNNDVSGNGMQTQVKGSDVVSFEVTASYLDFYDSNKTSYKTTDDGNVSTMDKTFDKNSDGTFNISSDNGSTSNDEMRSFDSTKMYSSAVLFKVDYEILAGCEKSFRIYATCPYTTEHMTENVFTVIKSTAEGETDTYYSSVSNAVFLTEVSLSGDEYSVKSSSETEAYNVKFIKEDYSKYFTKYLKTGIKNTSTTTNLEGTLYYLMDYDEDLFNVLTNAMLTSGGTLNSKIILDGDVVFGIEEYDTEATTPSVESVTFVNSTSVTTQAAGSDVMTSSWQFLLDYSDDTLETVKYNSSDSSDFVITGLDTSVVGENKTVTITYKGITVQYQPAEGEATTEIPYTISKATTVTGITLNKYTLSLIYNSDTPATAQLTATISPSDATNQTVLWTSSNTSVATVSSTGLVTATGAGTATITAKSDANNEITNSCTVTVTASSSATAVTGVTLDSKTLALYVNSSVANADKATLTATITPEGATNKDVTWTSSDSTVATVDDDGNVTALSVGTTNITVTTSDGGFTAVCSVMVYDASTMVSVTGVSLDKTTLSLTVGDSSKLTASITPSNATITSVSWSSSDDTVATVSSTGVVTAKKAGTATITVTTADGEKTATCAVTVSGSSTVAVTGVTLNKTSTTITVGSSETLTATVAPADATNKNVTWSTSDSGVATVADGVVTAVAAGTATITVTTEEGSYSATCTVTVSAAASTGYTVTFKNYDGSTLETDTEVLSGSTPSYDGSTPSRDEDNYNTYSFAGWSDGTQTYAVENLPAVTADVTYVAQFTAVPKSEGTVTYIYTYGGTNGTEWDTTSVESSTSDDTPVVLGLKITKKNSDTFSLTASGKKATITMTGFTTGSSNAQPYVTVTFKDASSTSLGTLTGTTTASKKLGSYTFTSNGVFESDTAFTSIEFTCNTTDKSFAITSVTIVIESESSGGTDPTSFTVTFSSSITATGMPESQSVESGGKVTKPATNPTATGYTFDGWYKDEGCTTVFDFDTETITGTTTIYAKWTASSGSTVAEYSVAAGTLTDTTKDGVINMLAGTSTKYDSKTDASWSGTINGETKTYSNNALRPSGDGRAATVVLKAGETVYVAFGANHSGKANITFNGITSTYDSVNKLYSSLFSYTSTNGETYTLNWTANMYVYAIIIVPAS